MSTSWVQMLEEEEEDNTSGFGVSGQQVIVEHTPPSAEEDGRDYGCEVNNDDSIDDVLELHCDESEFVVQSDVSDGDGDVHVRIVNTETESNYGSTVALPVRNRRSGGGRRQRVSRQIQGSSSDRTTVQRGETTLAKQRRRQRRTGGGEVHSNNVQMYRVAPAGGASVVGTETVFASVKETRDTERPNLGNAPHRSPVVTTSDTGTRNTWTVRWVRAGFEQLVYDVCGCNEAPNVIFTTLCYRGPDVFTMVLKNCNCKRRYWYDMRSKRRTRRIVGDFERAMLWRANAIGRPWSSPGYDLASFVLQHVAADRRIGDRRTPSPLILVTTDEMLDEPLILDQLVYRERTRPEQSEACAVCRAPSGIVTQDNACLPTFTCWQHSSSQLANSSADRTRVCDTIAVDMQFSRLSGNGGDSEYVCRLSAVVADLPTNNGHSARTRKITIAELVALPADVDPSGDTWARGNGNVLQTSSVEEAVDPNLAHSACCSDGHTNDEDLFPSMPINGAGIGPVGGSVRYYDTTVGRLADRIHCTASKFQK